MGKVVIGVVCQRDHSETPERCGGQASFKTFKLVDLKQPNRVVFTAHSLTETASALSPHSCRTSQIPGNQKHVSNTGWTWTCGNWQLSKKTATTKDGRYSSCVHLFSSHFLPLWFKLPFWQGCSPTKTHKPRVLCPEFGPHSEFIASSLYRNQILYGPQTHSFVCKTRQPVCAAFQKVTVRKKRCCPTDWWKSARPLTWKFKCKAEKWRFNCEHHNRSPEQR